MAREENAKKVVFNKRSYIGSIYEGRKDWSIGREGKTEEGRGDVA